MSRMWLACSSENSNGAARRASRAAGRSSEPRMAAMTAVQHVDGLEEALDHVGARPGLVQQELRPAGDHFDLVGHVVGQDLGQVQRAGHPVDEGHRIDAERRLHRGLLEQVVQHHVGVGVTLEPDDQAGLASRRVVLGLGDPVEVAGTHQVLDLLRHRRDRGLVGHLRDDDACLAGPTLLDLGHGPQLDGTPARAERVEDALSPEDESARSGSRGPSRTPSGRQAWRRGARAGGWWRR